jgi:hypothetical protein
MTERNLIIFDIDGVLLNSDHRLPFMFKGDLHTYFRLAVKDTPIPQGIAVCKMFVENPNYRTIFVTGRNDSLVHRVTTLCHLQKYVSPRISDHQLIMREWPNDDDLHDTEKKPQMIENAGYKLNDIFMVFEDRNSIVEMWRSRGVIVYHTQEGAF